jgi:simple sugar transport system permease protein
MKKYAPILATAVIFALLLVAGRWRYGENFLSLYSVTSLLTGNAHLGLIALGSTFVILTGGIDLSVGAVMGLTTVVIASLVMKHDVHPALAIPIGLGVGTLFGFAMGCIIQVFDLAPFLVTLGGLFFARGLVFLISIEAIGIDNPVYDHLSMWGIELHFGTQYGTIGASTIAFLAVMLLGTWVAHFTRFGRNVYAIGGSEQSASLMGLPVARTKILVYTLSGFCSALAGVLLTLYQPSGDPQAGVGLELTAIAAVVIGGTLLSGGVGFIPGTLIGVLILGLIQSALTFENLLSWWASIATGLLLFIFISLQKILTGTTGLRRQLRAH